MVKITNERSLELTSGVRGFIIGNKVLTPYQYKKSFVAKKDGKDIVLTFQKTDKWGISHFILPFTVPCDPLSYRKEPLHPDTFMFRVYRHVTLCSPYVITRGKGEYGLDAPDQFCPVFDRHCHIIGIVSGVFCDKLLCIQIQDIV